MITRYAPLPTDNSVPSIVRELRAAFDARLTQLYAAAVDLMARTPPQANAHIVHVPFTWHGMRVEAMYNRVQDLFTQLVARPDEEAKEQRPPFTISLFLSTDVPDERVW
jgi:hypothetical protein